MSDLVEFLSARLDEDEQWAQKCAEVYPAPWDVNDRGHSAAIKADEPSFLTVVAIDQDEVPTFWSRPWLSECLEHIARHDPARVLREVEAKRRLLDHHAVSTHMRWVGFPRADRQERYCQADQQAAPCRTLLALASVYADHPDYRQEWA